MFENASSMDLDIPAGFRALSLGAFSVATYRAFVRTDPQGRQINRVSCGYHVRMPATLSVNVHRFKKQS